MDLTTYNMLRNMLDTTEWIAHFALSDVPDEGYVTLQGTSDDLSSIDWGCYCHRGDDNDWWVSLRECPRSAAVMPDIRPSERLAEAMKASLTTPQEASKVAYEIGAERAQDVAIAAWCRSARLEINEAVWRHGNDLFWLLPTLDVVQRDTPLFLKDTRSDHVSTIATVAVQRDEGECECGTGKGASDAPAELQDQVLLDIERDGACFDSDLEGMRFRLTLMRHDTFYRAKLDQRWPHRVGPGDVEAALSVGVGAADLKEALHAIAAAAGDHGVICDGYGPLLDEAKRTLGLATSEQE